MLKYSNIFFIISAFSFPTQLLAAPFCIQTQAVAAQCDYFDATQCRSRAMEQNGFCVANPAELVITPGGTGKYCLVLSSRQAQCIYADISSCQNDAGPANGVCIEKTPGNVQTDPYQFDVNRKY
jgi:hypothetical protein